MLRLLIIVAIFASRWQSNCFSQTVNLYTFEPAVGITEAPPDDGSSTSFISSGQHFTASRGDTIYVVWAESRLFTFPTGNHVFFAKSTDGGQTFGQNVRVNSTPAAFNPSMRVDSSGLIYVTYERQKNIFFTKSTDGGITFAPALLVIDSAGLPYIQEFPSIAMSNKGHVFIAWRDDRMDPGQPTKAIFTSASFDGGNTFLPSIQVNEVGTIARYFDVATDENGRVFVAYQGTTGGMGGIVVARSDDSGQSFSNYSIASDLPPGSGQTAAVDPSIAVSPQGEVGVSWEDFRNDQITIRFSSSNDYGQNFSPGIRVDDDPDPACCPQTGGPSLIWKNSVFYLAFGGVFFGPGDTAISSGITFKYRPSDTGGFVIPVNASAADGVEALHSALSLTINEQGQAFAAWVDNRYDPIFGQWRHIFGAVGTPFIKKGDLNLDDLITVADVVMELNVVFLRHSFPAPFYVADGNCDLKLTAADVVLLLRVTFIGFDFPCN